MSSNGDATLTDGCWLTLSEAAVALGVSVHSVRRKVRAGQLAARRIPTDRGPAWRVRLDGGATVTTVGCQGDAQGDVTLAVVSTPSDCDADGVDTDHPDVTVAPGSRQADATVAGGVVALVALVALVRDLQAELLARTEAAAAWQVRAQVLEDRVRALEAPKPTPAPAPSPEPIPPTPNVAPWDARWQARVTIVAAVLAVVLTALVAAPEFLNWPR